jgi:hypothetical protein
MFKLTCESHIPVKPATKKKKIKEIQDSKAGLINKAPLTKLKVQFTTLIVAGRDIIIVIILYRDLLLWSRPIKYI